MQIAVVLLLVAALAALTILAYRRHDTFRKVALPLYWASLLTLLGLAGEFLGRRATLDNDGVVRFHRR